jgi:hypothetical protein
MQVWASLLGLGRDTPADLLQQELDDCTQRLAKTNAELRTVERRLEELSAEEQASRLCRLLLARCGSQFTLLHQGG